MRFRFLAEQVVHTCAFSPSRITCQWPNGDEAGKVIAGLVESNAGDKTTTTASLSTRERTDLGTDTGLLPV